VTAIEVGLLTCGSSYSPTPSQPTRGQWPALLVFVPAYSGASVRDLHPLPESIISLARITIGSRNYHLASQMSSLMLPQQDQGISSAMVIGDATAGVLVRWAPACMVYPGTTCRRPDLGVACQRLGLEDKAHTSLLSILQPRRGRCRMAIGSLSILNVPVSCDAEALGAKWDREAVYHRCRGQAKPYCRLPRFREAFLLRRETAYS
jgi:hypothetical protein